MPTTLTIENAPSEWSLVNGELLDIELLYYDIWHGVGVEGAIISANTSLGAPFTTVVREGSLSGHYFITIGSRGILFTPSSGSLTIQAGSEFYDVSASVLVISVLQNSVDTTLTALVTYGLPASLIVILLLGAYVKVWSVPKRIRQINRQVKTIRRGKVPKAVADVKSRQELLVGLFNDTFGDTGIVRTSVEMPEESVPVAVPELGELLIQLSILTNLNEKELDDFKADISKMKVSEQAAFVKEVIMQEAIRAARRDNKTVEQVLADVHAQASKRVAGEAVTEVEAAEVEEPEVERVILASEKAPIVTKPHVLFEEPQSAKGGDFEFPSDRLSSFEIDALKKDLVAKGVPPAEIDTIIEQAKELPRDLVEELIRSITKD